MRKVVLSAGISLDGYIARPDGAVDFLFMPKDYSMQPFMETVDTAVMGRKTFDVAKAMSGGSYNGGGMKSYVFSRSHVSGEREGVEFIDEAPADLIARLRKKRGKNIWLMGGGELAREFLRADLVDGLHLGIVPVAIGEGLPLFPPGFPQRQFKLVEAKTFSRGLVTLEYQRQRR